ncbi:MAG: hypothetical protein UY63_C0005G0062 [Parcubacteria group bacterium GW2011_GWA2_51_10]|nr:MAG: hypothetical protein UY63_C0005G0062 [Parcubacteria group bacterium GW2011_GWA2_51_10]
MKKFRMYVATCIVAGGAWNAAIVLTIKSGSPGLYMLAAACICLAAISLVLADRAVHKYRRAEQEAYARFRAKIHRRRLSTH